jgi:hypothetical protein
MTCVKMIIFTYVMILSRRLWTAAQRDVVMVLADAVSMLQSGWRGSGVMARAIQMRDCPSSRATLRPLERPDIMPIYADLATLFARNVNVTELIACLATYNPDDRILHGAEYALHYHGQSCCCKHTHVYNGHLGDNK